MEHYLLNLFFRKLISTFIATAFASFVMSAITLLDNSSFKSGYNLGNQWISGVLIYSFYIGIIILIYGNAVSIVLELVNKKWLTRHSWLYLLLHGFFGLPLGLVFDNGRAALYGMFAALSYAIIDRWLWIRLSKNKNIRFLFLFPVLVCGLCWGYFQSTSQPMPAFTIEDAVELATSGNGTVIDDFPNEIGKWQGTIQGYQVERQTNAESVGKEKYIVTFTETWKKGEDEGRRYFSYRVERGSLTAYKNEGEAPPYS